jgi:hypothetical protein
MKPFIAADILLPAPQTDMGLWPALACDQFTSQPEYWQKAEALTQNAPSTLHITLPEAYLESPDVDGRIAAIHTAMADYRARVLTRGVHGFVYVERADAKRCAQGLWRCDLEAYSYEKGSAPLVRPSENTIVERIPPRLAVRRGAPLETPHIMMLLDDAACGVVEPFAKKKAALEKLYDTELMLGGGHIAGASRKWTQGHCGCGKRVTALGTQAAFERKIPGAAAGRRWPSVGDGNHSLATARSLGGKKAPFRRRAQPTPYYWWSFCPHPAWANRPPPLIILSIRSTAPFFVVSRRGRARMPAALAWARRPFLLEKRVWAGTAERVECLKKMRPAPGRGTINAFLTEFLAQRPGAKVDYIHGATMCARSWRGQARWAHPSGIRKSDLSGASCWRRLPKKTFFHGPCQEKRYYWNAAKSRRNIEIAADALYCYR